MATPIVSTHHAHLAHELPKGHAHLVYEASDLRLRPGFFPRRLAISWADGRILHFDRPLPIYNSTFDEIRLVLYNGREGEFVLTVLND